MTRHSGLLSAEQLSSIQRLIIHSKEFSWYFYESANNVSSESKLDWSAAHQDIPQLVHILVSPPGNYNSQHAEYLLAECGLGRAVVELLRSEGLSHFEQLHRFKANLLPPLPLPLVSEPHIDYDSPNASILVYINDSDGDTVFFDRALGDDPDGMSEATRFSPKAGDFVLFDGRQYHAATPPTRTRGRYVLSFVLK